MLQHRKLIVTNHVIFYYKKVTFIPYWFYILSLIPKFIFKPNSYLQASRLKILADTRMKIISYYFISRSSCRFVFTIMARHFQNLLTWHYGEKNMIGWFNSRVNQIHKLARFKTFVSFRVSMFVIGRSRGYNILKIHEHKYIGIIKELVNLIAEFQNLQFVE